MLAGRSTAKVAAVAAPFSFPYRSFPLDDPKALRAGLEGVQVVLLCAGPFVDTAPAMVSACLEMGIHYLDITGEIPVFQMAAALDERARRAGVMLLPGAGFDVVPSDSLAAHLKRRLPSATHLRLAFKTGGGVSRGTRAHHDRAGAPRRQGAPVWDSG